MRQVSRMFIFIAALMVVVCSGRVCLAGSIWARASGGPRRALHSDDTARQVGDILAIIIDEHSKIDHETGRDMNKSSKRKASISGNFDLLGALDTLTGKIFNLKDLSLTTDAESDFESEADYESDRSVKDQITVTVQDVQPNGNLVVLGKVERQVAGETQIVQVSGVVRPSDIAFANTVDSDQVADFQIVYRGRGQEKWMTRPGWLDRILNVISPF